MKQNLKKRVRVSAVALGALAAGVTYPLLDVAHAQAATITWNLVGSSPYLSGGTYDSTDSIQAFMNFNGNLYAGTRNGVYDYVNGSWHLVGQSAYLDGGSGFDSANDILSFAVVNGSIFAGTGNGVYQYDAATQTWTQAGSSQYLSGNTSDYSNWISTLADVNGVLYAGTDGNGVFMFNSQTSTWTPVGTTNLDGTPVIPFPQDYSNAVSVLKYFNNVLYAGTAGSGVYQYDTGTSSWKAVGGANLPGGLTRGEAPGSIINDLAMLNGTLYAGTNAKGVFKYIGGAISPSNTGWQQVGSSTYLSGNPPTQSQTQGDGSNRVNALLVENGLLYAGTGGDGVFDYTGGAWQQVGPSNLSGNSSDSSNWVQALIDPPPYSIYAGTSYGVYSFLPAPPQVPTPSHHSVTQSGWTETWTSVSGATSYNLYLDGKLYKSGIAGTSLQITGQAPASQHTVTVAAVNGTVEGKQSTADHVTTLQLSLTHSQVSQTGWVASWNAVLGATSYDLYIDGKLYKSGVSGTTVSVTGEIPATAYQVSAKAMDGSGLTLATATDAVTTLPLAAPVLSHTNITQTGWTESWQAVPGAASYNLYIDGTLYKSGVTGTSLNVTGESPNTLYHVTATAVDGSAQSPTSAVDDVQTPAAPATPTTTSTTTSKQTTVPKATTVTTGKPVLPWVGGGLAAVVAGGLLLWRNRKKPRQQ